MSLSNTKKETFIRSTSLRYSHVLRLRSCVAFLIPAQRVTFLRSYDFDTPYASAQTVLLHVAFLAVLKTALLPFCLQVCRAHFSTTSFDVSTITTCSLLHLLPSRFHQGSSSSSPRLKTRWCGYLFLRLFFRSAVRTNGTWILQCELDYENYLGYSWDYCQVLSICVLFRFSVGLSFPANESLISSRMNSHFCYVFGRCFPPPITPLLPTTSVLSLLYLITILSFFRNYTFWEK